MSYQAEFHNRTIALAIRDAGDVPCGHAAAWIVEPRRKPKAMAGGVFFFGYFGAKVATQERALGGHAPCGHG